MRTDWIKHDDIALALRLLTPANALAVEVSLVTGLRIGDVLGLTRYHLFAGNYIPVTERKTRKSRVIHIPDALYNRLYNSAGMYYVFEGAHSPYRHRTRQAVWYDVKRASKALRLRSNLAPHSARKVYAVQVYREKGLKAAQEALNHSDVSTTLIYLLSELI